MPGPILCRGGRRMWWVVVRHGLQREHGGRYGCTHVVAPRRRAPSSQPVVMPIDVWGYSGVTRSSSAVTLVCTSSEEV
jgi:hypothetical protein